MVQNTVWQGSASALSRLANLDASTATQADRKAARDLAETIATGLVSRDGQHVVKGNLRLHIDDQGQASISRQRFWHNSKNDAANELIRKLVTLGYGHQAEGVTQCIDAYLSTSGNKFGSQSYFKLVQRHASVQAESEGAELSGGLATAQTRTGGVFSRAPRINTDHLDYQEVSLGQFRETDESTVSGQDLGNTELVASEQSLQNSQVLKDGATHESIDSQALDGLVAQRGKDWSQTSSIQSQSMDAQVQDPAFKAAAPYRPPKNQAHRNMERQNALLHAGIKGMARIGAGGMGTAFSARLNGQAVVVKTLGEPAAFTLNRLVGHDIGQSIYLGTASSRLPDFAQDLSIAAPSHYLMRPSSDEPLQLLDAGQAKQLLKTQRAQGVMTALCEGEVMPMAQGVDMQSLIEGGSLSDADQLKVFSSLLQFGKEMTRRGIIHRDLKPDNMHVQPATGQLSIFDWDFSFKLSSKPGTPLPRQILGSPKYISPKVFSGAAYAHEADMHSIGMMMLQTRYPKVFDVISQSLFAGMHAPNSRSLTGGRQWLKQNAPASLLPEAFDQPVRADNFVSQLKARFVNLHRATEQELSTLRAKAQDLSKRLDRASASGAPGLSQARIGQLQAELADTQGHIQKKETELAQTRAFLQEAGLSDPPDTNAAGSPTQIVLGCLTQANEVAAIHWYDRSNAAQMYQRQIEHPALQGARPSQANWA